MQLTTMNLEVAERMLCEKALADTGTIVGAAQLLGITRHGLKRRIIKHGIRWTRDPSIVGRKPTGEG